MPFGIGAAHSLDPAVGKKMPHPALEEIAIERIDDVGWTGNQLLSYRDPLWLFRLEQAFELWQSDQVFLSARGALGLDQAREIKRPNTAAEGIH